MYCDIPKKKCDLRKENGSCKLMVECLPIVEKCKGCAKVENDYCVSYYNPKAKWVGERNCPLATHVETEAQKKKKIRVGQQKQRKYKN